jgi:hypothetical protein
VALVRIACGGAMMDLRVRTGPITTTYPERNKRDLVLKKKLNNKRMLKKSKKKTKKRRYRKKKCSHPLNSQGETIGLMRIRIRMMKISKRMTNRILKTTIAPIAERKRA